MAGLSWCLFPFPERRFGPGRILEIISICAEFGIARPLFVTDKGLLALKESQEVDFEEGVSDKGPCAKNVIPK